MIELAGYPTRVRGCAQLRREAVLIARTWIVGGVEGELMATVKRAGDALCTCRPKTAREARVMWRRRPTDRIVRWIGASGQRRAGSAQTIPAEPAAVLPQVPAGNVVTLTWAQTFGRPAWRA
jgi:hypothetical protein